MIYSTQWSLIEIGGSSIQTAVCDEQGAFHFTNYLVRAPARPVAVACPGVIRGERVLYATNLGWPADADPREELELDTIRILINDAEAAALGESVLRGNGSPSRNLAYVGLGTGVGSAAVRDGRASEWNLGHCHIGGEAFCEGCQSHGCLNAYLAADRLPHPLSEQDQDRVAQTLAMGLRQVGVAADLLLVIGGGIGRRYPLIATALATHIANLIELTAAPPEAKSAAYAGLDYLARTFPLS